MTGSQESTRGGHVDIIKGLKDSETKMWPFTSTIPFKTDGVYKQNSELLCGIFFMTHDVSKYIFIQK